MRQPVSGTHKPLFPSPAHPKVADNMRIVGRLLAIAAMHTNDAVESNLDWIKSLKGQQGTLPKPGEMIYSETRCSQISQNILHTDVNTHFYRYTKLKKAMGKW